MTYVLIPFSKNYHPRKRFEHPITGVTQNYKTLREASQNLVLYCVATGEPHYVYNVDVHERMPYAVCALFAGCVIVREKGIYVAKGWPPEMSRLGYRNFEGKDIKEIISIKGTMTFTRFSVGIEAGWYLSPIPDDYKI